MSQRSRSKEHDGKGCQQCEELGTFDVTGDTAEWLEAHRDVGMLLTIQRDRKEKVNRVYEK